jgi:hypothetical protein
MVLPELAYYEEVRVCKNCKENIEMKESDKVRRRINKQNR